jgi:integrase
MICQLHQLLPELIPGGATRDLSAAQATALLATVRPRHAAGQTRRRVAAELIRDLQRIYQRSNAADTELTQLLTATGTTLMGLPGTKWQQTELVFTTRHGTPLEPRNFHRDFKVRCRKARVREISVHTTRRTCASLLVALDVHSRVAMQILRHSQIAVTMNIYSEAPSKATQTALKRLSRHLDG